MALTVEWWKDAKKKYGKGAPSTGMEALLKKYEAALKTLAKEKTHENAQAAQKALAAVDKCRKEAIQSLSDDRWADLRNALNNRATDVQKAGTELEEVVKSLYLASSVEKAGSEAEAGYLRIYAVFEKQESQLNSSPGRLAFKTALSTLDKLLELAERCKETPHLIGKYNKQIGVLNGKKVNVAQLSTVYEGKINPCVALRRKAIAEVQEMDTALTRAKGQMAAILKKVQTAKSENNLVEAGRQKTAAGVILKGMLEKAKEISDKYLASGTVVKDATDVKAAHMAVDDMTEVIRPLSDELFKLNRDNNLAMKEIQELAQKIAA